MKLICDCGNELKFIVKDENNTIHDFEAVAVYADTEGSIDINIHEDNNKIWIECYCGKSIFIYA